MNEVVNIILIFVGALVYIFLGGKNIANAVKLFKQGRYFPSGACAMTAMLMVAFLFKLVFSF